MTKKKRLPGEWKAIAAGRAKQEKTVRTGRGLTNIPKLSETGSAAYRRSQQGSKKR